MRLQRRSRNRVVQSETMAAIFVDVLVQNQKLVGHVEILLPVVFRQIRSLVIKKRSKRVKVNYERTMANAFGLGCTERQISTKMSEILDYTEVED